VDEIGANKWIRSKIGQIREPISNPIIYFFEFGQVP
jgi:hypothetical protein